MKIKLGFKIELLVLPSFYDRKFIVTLYQQRSLVLEGRNYKQRIW